MNYLESLEYGAFEGDPEWESEVDRRSTAYIRWVQQALNKAMGLRLKVDGIIGPQTRSAIRSFQQKHGLVADGIAGPRTEGALKTALVTAARALTKITSPCSRPARLPCNQRTAISHFAQGKTIVEYSHRSVYQSSINGIAACVGASQAATTPIGIVHIVGHASGEGDPTKNMALGLARAHKAANDLEAALQAQGLKVVIGAPTSLSGVIVLQPETRGATIPLADNRTEIGRKQNRRVEILLHDLFLQPPGPAPAPSEIYGLLEKVKHTLGSLPLGKVGIVLPTSARFLDPAEQSEAMTVYHGSLDFTKILITNGLGYKRSRFTVAVRLSTGWHVAMNMGDLACWAGRPRSNTLVHELAHAWQSQHHGSDPRSFMINSLKCQALAEAQNIRGGTFSAYAYIPGKSFGEYAAEQIAQQVEHHYARRGRPTPSVITTIQSVPPNSPSSDNEASLKVISINQIGAPGVVPP